MKAELMGEGCFEYECKDPHCYFCDVMGLRPEHFVEPPPEVFIIQMATPVKQEEKFWDLSPYERRKQRENGMPTYRLSNYKLGVLKWKNRI